jgi:hypothetical protein
MDGIIIAKNTLDQEIDGFVKSHYSAQAGIQNRQTNWKNWIPVSTGMTKRGFCRFFTKPSKIIRRRFTMSRETMKVLMERWAKEPKFREELRRDLEGTLIRNGIKPGDTEWTTLRSFVLYN